LNEKRSRVCTYISYLVSSSRTSSRPLLLLLQEEEQECSSSSYESTSGNSELLTCRAKGAIWIGTPPEDTDGLSPMAIGNSKTVTAPNFTTDRSDFGGNDDTDDSRRVDRVEDEEQAVVTPVLAVSILVLTTSSWA